GAGHARFAAASDGDRLRDPADGPVHRRKARGIALARVALDRRLRARLCNDRRGARRARPRRSGRRGVAGRAAQRAARLRHFGRRRAFRCDRVPARRPRVLDGMEAHGDVRRDDRADVPRAGERRSARVRCRQRDDGRADRSRRARGRVGRQLGDRRAVRGERCVRSARRRVDRADHRHSADRLADPMSDAPFLADVVRTARGVVLAVLPLAVLFTVFQVFFLRLPRAEVTRIASGTLLASVGLFLFLLGVAVGFMPFGRAIGEAVGAVPQTALVALLGAVLGFVTTWGEPAVRILADQVEQASAGSIRQPVVLFAVCAGVAVAVGLGMLRIAYDLPLLWILVPGYVLAIALIWASDRAFVAIAVDSGGVATGPLANTFLLALALGAAAAVAGRDPLVHGLGLVALIALAP